MRTNKNVLIGILMFGLILLLNACTVVVKHPSGNTQPHTKTSFYHWYYYPNTQVYYHVNEHYYYFLDGGSWRKANWLPNGWVLDQKKRVLLRITGKPYLRHAYHQHKYPPENTAKHEPGTYYHGNRGDHPHGGNGKERDEHQHPVSLDKDHKPPHKPDHAADGVAKGRQQPPGHAKSEKEAPPGHANRVDTSGNVPPDPGQRAQKPQHRNIIRNEAHDQAMSNQHPHNRQPDEKHPVKGENVNAGNAMGNKPDNTKVKVTEQNSANHGKHNNLTNNKQKRPQANIANKGNANQSPNQQAITNDNRLVKTHLKDQQSDSLRNEQQRSGYAAPAGEASSANTSSKETANAEPNNTNGKQQKQAKKSNDKGKGKSQTNNGNEGDENSDEQVVELNVNKGKGKSR